jgi:hypothetical protein
MSYKDSRFKDGNPPKCPNCERLEKRLTEVIQRVDVLGTENERLKTELETANRRIDFTYGDRADLARKLNATEEEWERQRHEILDFDRRIEAITADANQKLRTAEEKLAKAASLKVKAESEIWARVSERVGIPLRTGYAIREEEVMLAFDLERERAASLKASFDQLTGKYGLLKQQALQLEQKQAKEIAAPELEPGPELSKQIPPVVAGKEPLS